MHVQFLCYLRLHFDGDLRIDPGLSHRLIVFLKLSLRFGRKSDVKGRHGPGAFQDTRALDFFLFVVIALFEIVDPHPTNIKFLSVFFHNSK